MGQHEITMIQGMKLSRVETKFTRVHVYCGVIRFTLGQEIKWGYNGSEGLDGVTKGQYLFVTCD